MSAVIYNCDNSSWKKYSVLEISSDPMLNDSEWHKCQCKDNVNEYKFNLYGKNTGGFQFGNIVLRFSAGPKLKIRFLDNANKLSTRTWQ